MSHDRLPLRVKSDNTMEFRVEEGDNLLVGTYFIEDLGGWNVALQIEGSTQANFIPSDTARELADFFVHSAEHCQRSIHEPLLTAADETDKKNAFWFAAGRPHDPSRDTLGSA